MATHGNAFLRYGAGGGGRGRHGLSLGPSDLLSATMMSIRVHIMETAVDILPRYPTIPPTPASSHSDTSPAITSSKIVAKRMVNRASPRVYSRADALWAARLPMTLARLTRPS